MIVLYFESDLCIAGKNTAIFRSPKTTYVAYLVFKFVDFGYSFERVPVELLVNLEGYESGEWRRVLLDPLEATSQIPREEEMDR